jgi:hypothetical protein
MRSVVDYLTKATEFERLAEQTTDASLKKRYADMASCYRFLADERIKLIKEGVIVSDENSRH